MVAVVAALATTASVVPAAAAPDPDPRPTPESIWGNGGEVKVPPVKVGTTKPPKSAGEQAPSQEVSQWREAEERRATEGKGGKKPKGLRAAPSAESAATTATSAHVPEGQGDVPWHEITDIRVTDSLVARINYSTGNLMLAATDFDVAGVGQNLRLARTYNSLDAPWGKVSQRWWQEYERYLLVQQDAVVFYDETGASVRFAKDGDSFTTPDGSSKDLTRDDDGSYTLTDRKSGMKDHFSTHGTLTSVEDRNGGRITVDQHDEGAEHKGFKLTEERSGRWVDLVKTHGNQWQAKDHTGRTAVFNLNQAGDLAETIDTEGKKTTFDYDSDRRLTKITTPEGRVTVFTYDAHNRVTSMLRATEFDGSGHTGPTYRYAYTAASPGDAGTTTATDPLGHATKYEHNADGEVEKVIDPLGHERSRSYDAHNVVTATDAMGTGSTPGNTAAYGWDSRNNPTSAQLPTGATAALTGYQTIAGTDLPGTLTSPDGEKTDYSYDASGNTTSVAVSGAGGGTREFTYNDDTPHCGGFEGQRCSAKDAGGKVTKFEYDSKGNLKKVTPPTPMGTTTYTYDRKGRPATVVDGRGVQTVYSYDERDRVTQVSANYTTVKYTYDGDGNLTSRTDDTGVMNYAYDPLSRETVRSTRYGGTQTVLTYTADGNVDTYTDPGGTTDYHWDAANRLEWLKDPEDRKTTYAYDNNDARTETTYPGGTTQTVTLDESSRPTRIKATSPEGTLTELSYDYSYTAGGEAADGTKIRTKTDHTTDTTTTYTYNEAGRLARASESGDGATWQYCWNPAGNLTSQGTTSGCPAATTYTYNDASQLTAKNDDTTGWSYDETGNELAAAPTPETARTDTTWSHYSQMTSVTVDGTTYDAEYASTDQSERRRFGDTWLFNGPVGVTRQATVSGPEVNETGFIREPGGTLNSMTSEGKAYYYLTDALGSVIAMTDETGAKANTYAYTPTGTLRTDKTTQEAPQPYRFAAGYQDPTGLYHLNARFYDPTLGRFTQPDPSGQEVNPYLYAEGDPTNRIDQSGLLSKGGISDALGKVGDVVNVVEIGQKIAEGDWTGAARESASLAAGVVVGSICTASVGASSGFLATAGCFAAGANTGAAVESWLSP